MEYVKITEIIFSGKRSLPWDEVEEYLSKYSGKKIMNEVTGDVITIGSHFASEYCGSIYTKKLRGTIEKAKANAVQVIPELIRKATNRRWIENKENKHSNDAKGGWYRYDIYFSLPIAHSGVSSENYYRGTIVVRINDSGIYLHDIINIKKEDSKPLES